MAGYACHRNLDGRIMVESKNEGNAVNHQWAVRLFATICLMAAPHGFAQNLVENGSFDDSADPLAGWVTDYSWTKNNQYMENVGNVEVVSMEAGYSNVCRLFSDRDAGTKMETVPIPFEEGYRYTCTLKFKGPDYRIYFAGYRWKPRVKPYDDPDISDLRAVYKSRAETGQANGWTTVKLELPGKKMTRGMQTYLKQVKYITLFVYVTRTGYIDEVKITRHKDPSVTFDK